MVTASYLSRNGMKTIHDFASLLTEATQVLNDEKAKVKAKEKRIRDIDAILDAVKDLKELHPIQEKYDSIFFKGAKEK